jgi:deazaflavin-dependent oxidoreductase (nitroreductase family)
VRHAQARRFRRVVRALPGNAVVARLYGRILPPVDRLMFWLTRGRHTLASVLSGLPVVLLETRGARSGQRRIAPLVGVPDGDDLVVVASNWGRPRHPGWYHNLRAEPEAVVRVNGERRPVRARETAGEERERRWQQALALYPVYATYARRAGERKIPVLVLSPASDGA